jgi:ATP-dependent RNA helicase SUPV3L1/SUV3
MDFRDTVMKNLTDRMDDGKYSEAPPRIPTPKELFDAHVQGGMKAIDPLLLKYFKRYYFGPGHPSMKDFNYDKARDVADMRNPGEWYPAARNMRRKIIMHVGPTNSGKTYQALKKLETANSGWYGGPLRLLAHEVFHRMNNKGIKCNLKTGEEIRVVDINAPITSSTIEMFSETTLYDVAVIDEIQMLSDRQRGFAWSSALLGLKAKEIHLCGEEAAVPIVTEMAKQLGEEIEVNKYQRLSPLKTASTALSSYKNIQKGDCVVAFSRWEIFQIRERIERDTKFKCALVYGGLPPESRSLQAALFNDPDSGFDVIVASDAIGMGLNLYIPSCRRLLISYYRNIKRVIFATLEKFNAGNMTELFPPQIKQIAGRAGRFRIAGLISDSNGKEDVGGIVTTLKSSDLVPLADGMRAATQPLSHAMLWPPYRVFEQFTHHFPVGTPLAVMIAQFADVSKQSLLFRAIESEPQSVLATAIEHLPNIDPESRYSITFAPINERSEDEITRFVLFAEVMSNGKPVTIESPLLRLPLDILDKNDSKLSHAGLKQLEILHKLITCYCWLSYVLYCRHYAYFLEYDGQHCIPITRLHNNIKSE